MRTPAIFIISSDHVNVKNESKKHRIINSVYLVHFYYKGSAHTTGREILSFA